MSKHEAIRHLAEDEKLHLFPLGRYEADAIHNLLVWMDGYLDGRGEGMLPGHHELLMAYRGGQIVKDKKKD